MTEDKKEIKEEYKLVNVATAHETMIQAPNGEVLTVQDALVEVLNVLKDVKNLMK